MTWKSVNVLASHFSWELHRILSGGVLKSKVLFYMFFCPSHIGTCKVNYVLGFVRAGSLCVGRGGGEFKFTMKPDDKNQGGEELTHGEHNSCMT